MNKGRLLVVFFLMLQLATANAQGINIDSLKQVAAAGKADTNTVIACRALCGTLGNIAPREGITYGWKGVALAKKIKWDKGIAGCYLNLGLAFGNIPQFHPCRHVDCRCRPVDCQLDRLTYLPDDERQCVVNQPV